MTGTTATTQLQAWLDGHTSVLSKGAVRTVLWDLAEAQTQLEQHTSASAPAVVWYFTDDDESGSGAVYPDRDTAQAYAVRAFIDGDSGELNPAEFTWREIRYGNGQTTWQMHYEDGDTGWTVDRIDVVASIKAGV